ncbi:MAG TPA: phosphoribosylglycinamide formyltransferase, partial [Pantoea septica]|nr:phosphoribosylglycinamide formyltransferase [Pantoea septica]
MKKLVVLISGYGSNLQSSLDPCASGRINGSVAAVFSNKSTARGLTRAR